MIVQNLSFSWITKIGHSAVYASELTPSRSTQAVYVHSVSKVKLKNLMCFIGINKGKLDWDTFPSKPIDLWLFTKIFQPSDSLIHYYTHFICMVSFSKDVHNGEKSETFPKFYKRNCQNIDVTRDTFQLSNKKWIIWSIFLEHRRE